MELDEIARRKLNLDILSELEERPSEAGDPYLNMNRDELVSQIRFLLKLQEDKDAIIDRQQESLDEMKADLKEARKDNKALQKQLAESSKKLDAALASIEELRRQLTDMMNRNDLNNQHRFGSRSQKGITPKKSSGAADRTEQKDSFSVPEDIQDSLPVDFTEEEGVQSAFHGQNALGPHKRMEASRKVFHKSDKSRIPAGAVFIGFETRKRFDEVHYIVEHDYQLVKYKTADGRIELAYLPPVEEKHQEMLKSFPGTHASTELLSNLIVNKYQICTPLHRELTRMLAHNMSLSEKTLTNWLDKVSKFLYKMLPALKAKALEAGTAVNCDETWCRVRISDKYTKKYIWCLVNRQTKSVLFFYDNGSRGRQVLTDFLGSAEIVALQSDGYNAYTFLDNELTDIEHICCMAHVRAKFKYAYDQGKDIRAQRFLIEIGKLYDLERKYKERGLSRDEITRERNSAKTKDIVATLSMLLHETLRDEVQPMGDLMLKALHYLQHFWNQLFAYLKDGLYCIDNNIAERSIRPMTVERKNSLMFGSHKGAEMSAIFHTFIETCKINGISTIEYFKKLLSELLTGNNNYASLLPQTIGIRR